MSGVYGAGDESERIATIHAALDAGVVRSSGNAAEQNRCLQRQARGGADAKPG